MRQKLNIVTLGVKDLKRSLRFYPREKLAEDAKTNSGGNGFSGITLAYNAKGEAEVDEVLKTVEDLGATIVKKAEKVFWGGYSGYFADFDEHLWEVAWNPFFEFDESDNLVLP
ncbi:MAG: VOC family protein [Rivularia sp. T60_A2020_040]|nr:VOC family protein [Rivularia sp. T60_A2020_040]